jgi:hypothetical protein
MWKFWFAALVSIPVLATAYAELVPRLSGLSRTTIRGIWAADGLLALAVRLYSRRHFIAGMVSAFRHRSADMALVPAEAAIPLRPVGYGGVGPSPALPHLPDTHGIASSRRLGTVTHGARNVARRTSSAAF